MKKSGRGLVKKLEPRKLRNEKLEIILSIAIVVLISGALLFNYLGQPVIKELPSAKPIEKPKDVAGKATIGTTTFYSGLIGTQFLSGTSTPTSNPNQPLQQVVPTPIIMPTIFYPGVIPTEPELTTQTPPDQTVQAPATTTCINLNDLSFRNTDGSLIGLPDNKAVLCPNEVYEIPANSPAITIPNGGYTLDCQGSTIQNSQANQGQGIGILIDVKGVRIQNCKISGYGTGIEMSMGPTTLMNNDLSGNINSIKAHSSLDGTPFYSYYNKLGSASLLLDDSLSRTVPDPIGYLINSPIDDITNNIQITGLGIVYGTKQIYVIVKDIDGGPVNYVNVGFKEKTRDTIVSLSPTYNLGGIAEAYLMDYEKTSDTTTSVNYDKYTLSASQLVSAQSSQNAPQSTIVIKDIDIDDSTQFVMMPSGNFVDFITMELNYDTLCLYPTVFATTFLNLGEFMPTQPPSLEEEYPLIVTKDTNICSGDYLLNAKQLGNSPPFNIYVQGDGVHLKCDGTIMVGSYDPSANPNQLPEDYGLMVEGDNVVVDGCNFINLGYGVTVGGNDITLNNVRIGNSFTGLLIGRDSSKLTIKNSAITECNSNSDAQGVSTMWITPASTNIYTLSDSSFTNTKILMNSNGFIGKLVNSKFENSEFKDNEYDLRILDGGAIKFFDTVFDPQKVILAGNAIIDVFWSYIVEVIDKNDVQVVNADVKVTSQTGKSFPLQTNDNGVTPPQNALDFSMKYDSASGKTIPYGFENGQDGYTIKASVSDPLTQNIVLKEITQPLSYFTLQTLPPYKIQLQLDFDSQAVLPPIVPPPGQCQDIPVGCIDLNTLNNGIMDDFIINNDLDIKDGIDDGKINLCSCTYEVIDDEPIDDMKYAGVLIFENKDPTKTLTLECNDAILKEVSPPGFPFGSGVGFTALTHDDIKDNTGAIIYPARNARYVKIHNCNFQNFAIGGIAYKSPIEIRTITFVDNKLMNFFLIGSDKSKITNNNMAGNSILGAIVMDSNEVKIKENDFISFHPASSETSSGIAIINSNNTVLESNVFTKPLLGGAFIFSSNDVRMIENEFSEGYVFRPMTSLPATLTYEADNLRLTGNTYKDNNVNLILTNSKNAKLIGTEITGNKIISFLASQSTVNIDDMKVSSVLGFSTFLELVDMVNHGNYQIPFGPIFFGSNTTISNLESEYNAIGLLSYESEIKVNDSKIWQNALGVYHGGTDPAKIGTAEFNRDNIYWNGNLAGLVIGGAVFKAPSGSEITFEDSYVEANSHPTANADIYITGATIGTFTNTYPGTTSYGVPAQNIVLDGINQLLTMFIGMPLIEDATAGASIEVIPAIEIVALDLNGNPLSDVNIEVSDSSGARQQPRFTDTTGAKGMTKRIMLTPQAYSEKKESATSTKPKRDIENYPYTIHAAYTDKDGKEYKADLIIPVLDRSRIMDMPCDVNANGDIVKCDNPIIVKLDYNPAAGQIGGQGQPPGPPQIIVIQQPGETVTTGGGGGGAGRGCWPEYGKCKDLKDVPCIDGEKKKKCIDTKCGGVIKWFTEECEVKPIATPTPPSPPVEKIVEKIVEVPKEEKPVEIIKSKFNWWWLLLLLIPVIASAGYLYYKKYHPDTEPMKQYISYETQHGTNAMQIKENLIKAGWPESVVNKTFAAMNIEDYDTKLHTFIRECLGKGMDKGAIVKGLASRGWELERIEQVFTEEQKHILPDNYKAQLSNYVSYYTNKGMPKDKIKESLIKSGWNKELIEEYLK